MTDEDVIRSLGPMDSEKYEYVDNDRLILYVVSYLNENNIEPTFDKIVATAYKLFLDRFSLIGFPEYPDGKRIHDCLFHCTYKPKKWLAGSAKSGFVVTERGEYYLSRVKLMFVGTIKGTKKEATVVKRKEVHFLNQLKKSVAYKKFTTSRGSTISEDEACEALRVFDNNIPTYLKHLEKYLEYARRVGETTTVAFLEFIKQKTKSG